MNLSIPCIDVRTAEEQSRTAQAYLLDVRGFDEFASGHAEGAVCIPLPVLEQRLTELPTDQPVLVMCQSGGRSAQAVEQLQMWGLSQVLNVEGGFGAWRQAGLPIIRETNTIPLERQVRIAAGILVLSFSLLGFLLNPAFFWGAGVIGFLLTLTGILGVCPMMSVLQLLPWNRTSRRTAL